MCLFFVTFSPGEMAWVMRPTAARQPLLSTLSGSAPGDPSLQGGRTGPDLPLSGVVPQKTATKS